MRPLRDAFDWTVKKVGDHPALSIGIAIGGALGSALGPLGTAAGMGLGAQIGDSFDTKKDN